MARSPLARTLLVVVAGLAGTAPLAGCVVYEPVPAYNPYAPKPAPTFERAWNAALGALEDTGVRVTSADNATGVIRGSTDESDVTVNVTRQADGTTQVEISAKRPEGRDVGLAGQIADAYQRRAGR